MYQFKTTSDFTYKGQSLPDMPLLVDKKGEPVLVVNRFLLYLKLEVGKVHSPQTIQSYSDSLYDYFSFLEAQRLQWDDQPKWTDIGKEVSNLALYQRWCHETYKKDNGSKLKHSTINTRIGHIERFYRWAKDIVKLIDWLPFVEVVKTAPLQEHPDFLAHTHAGTRTVIGSENRLPEKKEPLKLLTIEQCWELRSAPMSTTLRNCVWLMLGSGIRNEECRTIPRHYVFNPESLDRNKRIRIYLNSGEMKTKGEKSRYIFISWSLMNALYQYVKFGEGAVRAKLYEEKFGHPPTVLFLNENGHPFGKKGLNNAFRKICKGYEKRGKWFPPVLSFHVNPHKLRHTFATMELHYESEKVDRHGRKKGLGWALKWVQKRLGHSSLQSVSIYLHCVHELVPSELNKYQQELDTMMVEEGARP